MRLHKTITICVTFHFGTDTCVGNTNENGTESRKTFNCEAKSKKKGKGSSVKRKPQGKNQKGGSSVRRKPKRKNQKGGFILSPGFIRNDPFTRMADSALDYDRRKRQAKKRGKKFKRKKTSDDIWGFIERNLG